MDYLIDLDPAARIAPRPRSNLAPFFHSGLSVGLKPVCKTVPNPIKSYNPAQVF